MRMIGVKMGGDHNALPVQPGREVSNEVVWIRDGMEVYHIGCCSLGEQPAIHLKRMGPVEVDAQGLIKDEFEEKMIEQMHRHGASISSDEHPIVPIEAAQTCRPLVERRVSPILFLLKNIQRKNSHLIPDR